MVFVLQMDLACGPEFLFLNGLILQACAAVGKTGDQAQLPARMRIEMASKV